MTTEQPGPEVAAGDVEALAAVVGHVLSEYIDDAAPLNERLYVAAARHVLSVDGSPGMSAYFAQRDAAQRAEGAELAAEMAETYETGPQAAAAIRVMARIARTPPTNPTTGAPA